MATLASNLHLQFVVTKSEQDMRTLEQDNWEELPSWNDLKSRKESETQIQSNITFRMKIQSVVDSIWLQTFIVLLVVFDLIIGFTKIISNQETKSILTLIIIIIYCVEIIFRIYAYGVKTYFTSILDIIDFIAVAGSLILYIFSIYVVYALLVKILRWIRVIRTTYRAIFSRTKKIQKAIRQLQRSNLKGYRDEKYDLDVAYITDNILIMSRPASKVINQWNHDALSDIKQFLDEKHPNSYIIYDLCVYDDEQIEKKAEKNDIKAMASSNISLFPLNIDVSDGQQYEYNEFGPRHINNDFAFRGSTVISLHKLFNFTEQSTTFHAGNKANVIIIQSTYGLGRCMFMTACLLFYYYPTASLADIMKFIHNERLKTDTIAESVAKFLPSQIRYIRYFATLISHCYRLSLDEEEEESISDDFDNDGIDRALSQHMETIHHSHQQTMRRSLIIYETVVNDKDNTDRQQLNYHQQAMEMLNSKIGVVIKHISIHNYFDEIDPYVNWECDIFKWKNDEKCVEYDTFKYGVDSKPGKNSALIKRFEHKKPMVLQNDFGVRLYKSWGHDRKQGGDKRKLMAQIMLHSMFITIDKDKTVTFQKREIDFVNKDTNNKHFPNDFHIVLRAKILRKKV